MAIAEVYDLPEFEVQPVDGDRLVGSGGFSKVFRLTDGLVAKVPFAVSSLYYWGALPPGNRGEYLHADANLFEVARQILEHKHDIARRLHETGISVPKPEGVFNVPFSDEMVSHGQVVQVTIVRQSEATVESTVVAGDGETAVPGTNVELRSSDGATLLQTVTTDDARYFRIMGAVEPGTSALVRTVFSGDDTIRDEETVSTTEPG